ncbi:Retrovirus-related Pol polyprotein from transposon TNT 1-94 [Vitis vinifera]|uniref:Retrovirus-related Pol polyprotein from transposon TNT 1-94 n=1 Tax=Vitis vinifera TaxID=29760 RepID=A0A438DX83_VITVI|nr:Retrovirus-related Pol polyprotein from transposon TNT 1-94 [Vitis vinifera]
MWSDRPENFEGEIFNSLISNLNGGDWIWSSGRFSQRGDKIWLCIVCVYPIKVVSEHWFKIICALCRTMESNTSRMITLNGQKIKLMQNGIYFIDSLRKRCKVVASWYIAGLVETFRTSLSNSAPDGIMNMDLVKSCVLHEEMRRKSQGSSSQSNVPVTEKRRRSKSRGPKNRDRSKSKTNKFANVECHYCHLKGHIKKYCRQLKRDMKQGKVKERRMTMVVIDSGASIHATPRKDFFTSYTFGDFGSVRMGNDGSAKAIGMGDESLMMKGSATPSVIARVIDSSINAMDDDSTFELWHNRLGHMSEKGLMILAKKNLLSGMKKGSLKRCAHCLAGKQTRVAFKTLHHTRKPNQVLDVFKQFHALVERQSGKKLKCIRTDNGSRLPRSFWGEVLNTVVHVLNLTPCVPLEFDVPDRIWSNNEISYDHLRVFGCKAFVYIPKDERSKLDAKTRPYVFIGYGQDELGYRFYDPVQKKLVRSRDVMFMEDHTIQAIEKTNPMESQHSGDLIDLDPAPLTNPPTQVEDEAHDDQHDMGDVETPTQVEVDDDVHEQSPAAEAPSDIPLRRSTRDRHPSTRYSVDDYVLLTDGGEPESYVEAMEDENKMKWVDAMQDEMESLHENHSFELVKLPKGKKALRTDKEIYMEQPKGFVLKRKEDYVCKLKKSVYGLKQAPRQWYKKFESVMGEQGYRKTTSDHCVFVQKFSDDDFVILLLYVDDILIVGRNVSRIDNLKKQLSKSFAMKDLVPVKRILGIRIERDRASKKLYMLQEQYIEKVFARFNMSKAKVVSSPLASHFKLSSKHSPSTDKEKENMRRVLYASAVGSLMYAMVCTRPDIAYAVGVVSRFLSNPGIHHWEVVKWIMRYLRGTSKLKLTFGSGKPILVGYNDSDMAGDVDNRRSTSGYLMTFSGGVVSWQSRLQKCVALSTTKAEYIAAAEACKELFKNSTYHARSKHIDVRYHWMRDALNDNLFEIEKIHTDNNGSDMLTKTLPREKLGVCCSIAGIISSNGRSRFVCGPIDLKFEGEIFNSLISNLNGGDRIWSSGRLLFQSVNSASLLLNFFSPGQF